MLTVGEPKLAPLLALLSHVIREIEPYLLEIIPPPNPGSRGFVHLSGWLKRLVQISLNQM